MGDFGLSEKEAQSLAAFVRKHSKSPISAPVLGKGNPDRGKALFLNSGCVQCHQSNEKLNPQFVAVEKFDDGCLSTTQKRDDQKVFPRLKLNKDQKRLLAFHLAAMKSKTSGIDHSADEALGSTPNWKSVSGLVKKLRCNSCHKTEQGGPQLPEIIYEEGVVGLNPERLPDLTQVGNKLHPEWIEGFLSGTTSDQPRPWLKTRMPKFKAYAKFLSDGLAHHAGYDSKSKVDSEADPKLASIGSKLVSQNSGLDCRECHGGGELTPRGDEKTQIVLGVNFSLSSTRIRKEYFDRWMNDPLRIDPQTKMPRYSTDGKTTKIKEIFDGDAKKQFDALWHYLNSIPAAKKNQGKAN